MAISYVIFAGKVLYVTESTENPHMCDKIEIAASLYIRDIKGNKNLLEWDTVLQKEMKDIRYFKLVGSIGAPQGLEIVTKTRAVAEKNNGKQVQIRNTELVMHLQYNKVDGVMKRQLYCAVCEGNHMEVQCPVAKEHEEKIFEIIERNLADLHKRLVINENTAESNRQDLGHVKLQVDEKVQKIEDRLEKVVKACDAINSRQQKKGKNDSTTASNQGSHSKKRNKPEKQHPTLLEDIEDTKLTAT
ncbi:hypothetical protein HK100_001532 [Physocladia obscura]|uniref:Uncharacterized protein n=1 Tax=Physocladia obscura TaxID=109957 RepID=A0AAD5SYB7_9FUNG|nr:hypothetical protein HK100_001532 [Physocladia obscura]